MANPTVNNVARLAGVSRKTISRVINRLPLLIGPETAADLPAQFRLGLVRRASAGPHSANWHTACLAVPQDPRATFNLQSG
jgi:hypothetical protein